MSKNTNQNISNNVNINSNNLLNHSSKLKLNEVQIFNNLSKLREGNVKMLKFKNIANNKISMNSAMSEKSNDNRLHSSNSNTSTTKMSGTKFNVYSPDIPNINVSSSSQSNLISDNKIKNLTKYGTKESLNYVSTAFINLHNKSTVLNQNNSNNKSDQIKNFPFHIIGKELLSSKEPSIKNKTILIKCSNQMINNSNNTNNNTSINNTKPMITEIKPIQINKLLKKNLNCLNSNNKKQTESNNCHVNEYENSQSLNLNQNIKKHFKIKNSINLLSNCSTPIENSTSIRPCSIISNNSKLNCGSSLSNKINNINNSNTPIINDKSHIDIDKFLNKIHSVNKNINISNNISSIMNDNTNNTSNNFQDSKFESKVEMKKIIENGNNNILINNINEINNLSNNTNANINTLNIVEKNIKHNMNLLNNNYNSNLKDNNNHNLQQNYNKSKNDNNMVNYKCTTIKPNLNLPNKDDKFIDNIEIIKNKENNPDRGEYISRKEIGLKSSDLNSNLNYNNNTKSNSLIKNDIKEKRIGDTRNKQNNLYTDNNLYKTTGNVNLFSNSFKNNNSNINVNVNANANANTQANNFTKILNTNTSSLNNSKSNLHGKIEDSFNKKTGHSISEKVLDSFFNNTTNNDIKNLNLSGIQHNSDYFKKQLSENGSIIISEDDLFDKNCMFFIYFS